MLEREHLGLMMEAGYVYLGMQRFKEAHDVFEGVANLAPDSEIPLIALGSVCFCQGKFANAIKNYKKALKADPESLYALAYMGEAMLFMGKEKDALKQLDEVSRKDPNGAAGNFARALLDALKKGFTPRQLSGVDEIKAHVEKQKKK